MSVSQAWLADALASASAGPNKTERVAMWIAAHYPTEGGRKFSMNDVRTDCRMRSYTDVIKCLHHLQNDGVIEVEVRHDGMYYCVTSSHLIVQHPDSSETTRRCDTKCDRSQGSEGTHYSETSNPLKGIAFLVAPVAATKAASPKSGSDEHWRWLWAEWRNRRLGSGTYRSNEFCSSQGQHDRNVQLKANDLVAKYGTDTIIQVLDAEKRACDLRGYSYNFDRFVRKFLEGFAEERLNGAETAQGSTISSSPDQGLVIQAEGALRASDASAAYFEAYHRSWRIIGPGKLAWQVDPGAGPDIVAVLQGVADRALADSTITVVVEGAR